LSDALVIIPTYEEKENIEAMVHRVMSLDRDFHLLVVDDASPDGTPELVKRLQESYPDRLFLEQRTGKQGLGTAYIHGFKWGLNRGYEYLFEMDADFSHDPQDLVRLYDACAKEGADLSIGSRYVKGGDVKNWPMNRIMMSWFASLYVRAVLCINIKDTTAGFKCYHRKVLESIDLDRIRFVGYAFQIEMKYAAKRRGFELREVPITFVDRKHGSSKMDTSIFKEAFLGVLKMKFQRP
jgi:dolichol-phosphate mannosyltransferase